MENAGWVLSRNMIEKYLLSDVHNSSTNLVDVHMRWLRQKIDHEFTDSLIHMICELRYILTA